MLIALLLFIALIKFNVFSFSENSLSSITLPERRIEKGAVIFTITGKIQLF